MKRFLSVVFAGVLLAFGVAACKKAHEAGNDSMSVGSSRITAEGDKSVNVRETPAATSAPAAASDVASSDARQ
ncbi:hypothetical protein B0G84_7959 [Paraburkholderia sp. BL8N3]|nr:hypothetical protein [Paraburkholderia sp. BL8N3]TCK33665.1 hypothetical protein B0G84_7959 [Paraburkholderia sp. BL8N3]